MEENKNPKKEIKAPKENQKNLMETGINGLDLHLNGGIPKGSTILLLGKPGSGIELFAQQFLMQALKNNELAWYFITRDPPSELKREMNNYGWTIEEEEKKGKIELINGYVARFIGSLPPKKLRSLAKKKDLKQGTDVLSKLQDYVTNLDSDKQIRGILDSVSDLIEDQGTNKISNLVKLISSVNRASDSITMILMTKGMHKEETENKLKHNSDVVIELNAEKKGNEIERELFIEKIRGVTTPSKIIPYNIESDGLKVQTTERVA